MHKIPWDPKVPQLEDVGNFIRKGGKSFEIVSAQLDYDGGYFYVREGGNKPFQVGRTFLVDNDYMYPPEPETKPKLKPEPTLESLASTIEKILDKLFCDGQSIAIITSTVMDIKEQIDEMKGNRDGSIG